MRPREGATLPVVDTAPSADAARDLGAQRAESSATEVARSGGSRDFWGYAAVSLQLGLFVLVVHYYEIASRLHLFPVVCTAILGFVVHACLPPRFRLAWFCFLSLAVVMFVLGWPNGALVIGIGAGLIAACYLPFPFAVRVSVVVLAALVLALMRLDLSRPFWPVLGSMFMFRLIVYLHESRQEKTRPPVGLTLAYFFPFQNVCFLFFPIVDFKTFRDTYRADAGWRDAQIGIVFLVRGLTHLLAYRMVKYYLLPSPHQLGDVSHVALFLASNYALYLHVSGYFHMITGIFHLFGFGLPRTHQNYFLASSFTDIWRRINIPWKEFMAKVFFFPVFFACRGLGTRAAIAIAALWVFVATWVLHSYQVFWLTGGFPLSMYDAGLWIVVGALVAWNLQRELTRAREPRTAADESATSAFRLAARVLGMFVLVSLFWACWTTPGFLPIVRTQLSARWLADGWWIFAVLAGLVVIGTLAKVAHVRLTRRDILPWRLLPRQSAAVHVAALSVAVVLTIPVVAGMFGPEAARRIGEVRRESVTPVEAARAVQGYYEEIADVPVRAGAWLSLLEGQPNPKQQTHFTDLTRPSDDFMEVELIPNWKGELGGSPITINRHGMRDRAERTLQKPAGVRRIAVVGSSVVMGYGVNDSEPFPQLVEDGLNSRRTAGDPRYEVLNFGTGKSFAIHRRVLLDRKVFAFDPDVLFVVGHQDEYLGPVMHLAKLVSNGNELRYPSLKQVIEKAGITPSTSWGEAQGRLQPHAREIVVGIYRDLVAESRRRGILPVWVYVPMPGVAAPAGLESELIQTAEKAGFVVVNLSDWADGRSPTEVKLSSADHHPNSLGQRLIADRLLEAIKQRPELLRGLRRDPP